MNFQLVPISLREAQRFVSEHHRHNKPPRGWRFGVGLEASNELIGVAIAGRPVSRVLDQQKAIEVTRVCTTGERNANSKLYGAILRAATALGYGIAYTYTLLEESGASMRAVGFEIDCECSPRAGWSTKNSKRQRIQTDLFGNQTRPTGAKTRWIKKLT